ncbi:hypothetical protein GOODEAATRI_030298, partial [Goodea atripinnis]
VYKRPHPGCNASATKCTGSRGQVLWAYEMEAMVEAYKRIIQNRSCFCLGCSETTIVVYKLRARNGLPPGLCVYRRPLVHVGCLSERPLLVIDQFNLSASYEGLPGAILISVFPEREQYSAMHVIHSELAMSGSEYGNRLFGEAKALEIVDVRVQAPPGHASQRRGQCHRSTLEKFHQEHVLRCDSETQGTVGHHVV